jgi:hypothetical protein
LSFLEIVHSGSGVIQLLHVRIIHNYWAFWELPKAFAHMYDIVWSFYNERLICEAVWLRRYRFWHCISLLNIAGQQDRSISLDWECPKKCHRTTYSYIIVTSHVKLETTWLSLASWDISASYFSSRPRIRIISSLHSSRSCESDTKHQHQKNEPVSLWELLLSGRRFMSLSRNLQK